MASRTLAAAASAQGLAFLVLISALASKPAIAAPEPSPIVPKPASTETGKVSEFNVIPPKMVSELVVTATKTVEELTVIPKIKCMAVDRSGDVAGHTTVVSAFPEEGAVVRPGLLVVRVTFSRPMACNGEILEAPPLQSPCPTTVQHLLLSYDRRTVRTVCVVDPNIHYGAMLNEDPKVHSFISLDGAPAAPHRFDFTTSSEPPISDVCEALAEDREGARQIERFRELDCKAGRPAGDE